MLTREAFNALLKTLEEPPAHCIFILATTESHKLPETIVSRTQRFNFKPVEPGAAAKHLATIAKNEKIDIEPEALELLAQHGGGSFRDSISLLDQLSGLGAKITLERAREFLGLPPAEAVQKLLSDIGNGAVSQVAQDLDNLRDQGVDSAMLAKALNSLLRDRLLAGDAPDWSVKLLRSLSAIGSATDPQAALEIEALEAASANQPTKAAKLAARPAAVVEEPATETLIEDEKVIEVDEPRAEPTPPGSLELNAGSWSEVMQNVKTKAPELYSALRLAEPRFEADKLTLAFQFPLHQKKAAQAKNIDALGKIIEDLAGTKLWIECIVDKDMQRQPKKTNSKSANTEPTDEYLQTINNIFGSTEVLES